MRYILALICPPLALLASSRPWQASFALGLVVIGLCSVGWGIGYFLIFVCVLWAMNAVSNDQAARVTRRFIRTVKPIRMFHN